jgi:hypothetical protein
MTLSVRMESGCKSQGLRGVGGLLAILVVGLATGPVAQAGSLASWGDDSYGQVTRPGSRTSRDAA